MSEEKRRVELGEIRKKIFFGYNLTNEEARALWFLATGDKMLSTQRCRLCEGAGTEDGPGGQKMACSSCGGRGIYLVLHDIEIAGGDGIGVDNFLGCSCIPELLADKAMRVVGLLRENKLAAPGDSIAVMNLVDAAQMVHERSNSKFRDWCLGPDMPGENTKMIYHENH